MPDALNRRRQDGPRRVRNGLKLKRKNDDPLPYPANRWCDALLDGVDEATRAAGLDYARAGQIVALAIAPPVAAAEARAGHIVRVEASVQGRSARPYATAIEIDAWTPILANVAIDAMAREAIYAAKLLSGELSPAVDVLCASLGAALLPAPGEHFESRCGCADPKPCKHHVAASLLMLERLADAPLLAFNLRGVPHELAIAKLQEARSLQTHGSSTAHATHASKTISKPFEACLADFWRPGPQLHELERAESRQHVSHAILRRLGPSPLQGKFPLVGLLASIYDSVRADAQRLRRGEP